MLYLCIVRDDSSRSSKGDLSHSKSIPFSAQKHSFRNAKRHIWRTTLKIFYSHPEGMKRERRERENEGKEGMKTERTERTGDRRNENRFSNGPKDISNEETNLAPHASTLPRSPKIYV